MIPFERAFAAVVGNEGGFTKNEADPGNWTGGRVGSGLCRGTNWGISAASYPNENIAGLTLADARTIYRRDYWGPMRGDDLPAGLGLLVFDAAVNNGVGQAVRWLQAAAGVKADGALGPQSMAAIKAADPDTLMVEFQAQRLRMMAALSTWRTFNGGWSRRLCRTMLDAGRYKPLPVAPAKRTSHPVARTVSAPLSEADALNDAVLAKARG